MRRYKMIDKIKAQQKNLAEFSQKISEIKDAKTAEQFLRSFLTPKELQELLNRYKLVEQLLQGIPQRKIAQNLGISISQISRGSEELQFGTGAEFFPQFFKELKS